MIQDRSDFDIENTPDAFVYLADSSTRLYGLVPIDYAHHRSDDQSSIRTLRRVLKEMRAKGAKRHGLVAYIVCSQSGQDSAAIIQKIRESISALLRSLNIPAFWKECALEPRGLMIQLAKNGKGLVFEKKKQSSSHKLRVLIVDDSKVIHKMLEDIISKDQRFEVCGFALNPVEAEGKIDALKPDALTLDFEMPQMDGLSYLKKMIPTRQLPVIMISGASNEDGKLALQALEFGAFDFIQKPKPESLDEFSEILCDKLFAATQVLRSKIKSRSFQKRTISSPDGLDQSRIVLIGASTGGTVALSEIISTLPKEFPAVVIVQHIPERFSMLFAERLDKISAVSVKEAADGDQIEAGQVLIAPGGRQLKIVRGRGGYYVEINDEPPVNRHRPSVDYMFFSAAQVLGSEVTAVLLTGMGKDGAQGLLRLKENGAHTIAQDADSCVVYGMPKAAAEIGAAQMILPLDQIAEYLMENLRRKKAKRG